MRNFRHIAYFVLITFVLIAELPTFAQDEIVVLHPPFSQAITESLIQIADSFSEQYGVQISLQATPLNEINSVLTTNFQAGGGSIDVAIMPHILGTQLALEGALTAYCLPGQCPECEESNPPGWCQYAAFGDFSEHMISDLLLPQLCLPGQCPECDRQNPPPWCGIASHGFEVDILQASSMLLINEEAFPYGIPVWWEFQSIVANNMWFEERGIDFPTQIEEFPEIFEAFETNVYADNAYFSRGEVQGNLGDESIPVYYTWPTTLVQLAEQVNLEDFTPLVIEDYQPEIFVMGAYAIPGGQQSIALDFIYFLGEEESQLALFEAAYLLPANGHVLEEVTAMSPFMANLVATGKTGKLAFRAQGLQAVQGGCTIGVDFSGYPDNYTFTPPNDFLISGIRFTSLGSMTPFVNTSGSVNGLQFSDGGLRITPVGSVFQIMESLTGSFNSEYDIVLYDRFGSPINSTVVPATNSVSSVILNGPSAAYAEFLGGGYEGVIVNICFNP